MFCEKCGTQMGDTDKFCEQCGWMVPEEAPAAEEAPVVEETPVVEEAPVVAEAPVQSDKKKGLTGKSLGLVIGGVALVVVLVLVFCSSSLAHFFKKTFASPEEYYSYIEKQQAEELIGMYMAYYDNYVMDLLSITDKSVQADVSVELSDELRDLLGYSGADFSWLESVNIGVNANAKDLGISGGLELAINGVDVISANTIIDGNEEGVYFQIPELNKTYIGAEFDDMDISFDEDDWEMFETIAQYMPASKELDALLTKYAGIALDCVEDVEMDSDELKAAGISQKCTVLEVTIDTDTVQAMAEAVLEEMVEDKDLEKLLKDTLAMAEEFGEDVDVDDAYDNFIENLEDALDDVDEIDMDDEEILMVLYVNNKGEVIGREIEMPGMKMTFAMPKQGSKFGYEYVMEMDDYGDTMKMVVEGEGKEVGSKLSGEFEIKVDTYSIIDMVIEGYNMDKAKKGEFVGSYTIKPSKALGTLLSAADMPAASAILDYSITVDMDMNADSSKFAMTVNDGDEALLKLAVSAKEGKGSKVSAPAEKNVVDLTDSDDLEDWLDEIDWDKFLEKLEDKVGVEGDYVDMLEDAIDSM